MGKKKSRQDPDRMEKMEKMGEGEEKMEKIEGLANHGSQRGSRKNKKMGNENEQGKIWGPTYVGVWGEKKKEKQKRGKKTEMVSYYVGVLGGDVGVLEEEKM